MSSLITVSPLGSPQGGSKPHDRIGVRDLSSEAVLTMSYIPPDAKWYLAEIVEEFRIESEPDNIVHTNMVLARADSPEEAYQSALALGKESEMTYTNPDGKAVQVYFRGLRDLNVIHDQLEHGAELIYSKRTGMSESDLAHWVSTKEDLGVFVQRDTSRDPTPGE
jgi:hypothetical protein